MKREIWKKIKGFENYDVSNKGRIRSKDIYVRSGRGNGKAIRRGRILKPIKLMNTGCMKLWQNKISICSWSMMKMTNKTFYLAPDILLTYILGDDKATNKFIDEGEDIVTSAFCFHEVISTMTVEEIKKHAGCIKFLLEKIPITDTKPVTRECLVQSEERRKHLRSLIKR